MADVPVDPGVIDDARAAAGLMRMNNVYYRVRHMMGKPSYSTKAHRLRMNWMAKPLGSKADFELFLPGGERDQRLRDPVTSHDQVVVEAGIGEEQVHDAVRIAAAIAGMAAALEAAA